MGRLRDGHGPPGLQGGHDGQDVCGLWRAEEIGEQVRQEEAVALGGPAESGEDLVCVGARARPVAGGDLAHDDGRPDLLLGQVVCGAQQRDVQVGEELILVTAQVTGEAPVGGLLDAPVQQGRHLAPDLVDTRRVVGGRQLSLHSLEGHPFEQDPLYAEREAGCAPLLDLQ
jgi:hypothetical protein